MDSGHMNAARFPLPALPQPHYNFDDIPSAERDFKGSTLHRVHDRHEWQATLGEMVLLCKQAIKRRRKRTNADSIPVTASKPLSLEYLADRSDVDDPFWGYMLRHEGRLQGFVTVTTFTNYHKSFRWDSLHPAAFEDQQQIDEQANQQEQQQEQQPTEQRALDSTGRLAQELQATVRAGDIWQEGIVWPRIAEVSLLGGLGCGKTLLKLVLEELVYAKRTPLQHYDYVVLQATDNSISFYESMGFIRVGALTTEANVHAHGNAGPNNGSCPSPRRQRQHGHLNSPSRNATSTTTNNDTLVQDWGSPVKKNSQSTTANKTEQDPSHLVVGPATEEYVTKKPGETPLKIAQSLRVDVQDVVFLNLRKYPELTTNSRLMAQTVLLVPKILPKETARQRPQVEIQWYTAKENDTPRAIAKMFNVPAAQVVTANKSRLPGLISSSKLKQGTKVRISKDDDGACWQAYAHWAFPEDNDLEEGEPSYMMALKLPKKPASGRKNIVVRPVLNSLAIDITEYQRPDILKDVAAPAPVARAPTTPVAQLPPPPHPTLPIDSLQHLPLPPVPPKRPPAAFLLYCNEVRQRKAVLLAGKNAGQASRLLKQAYDFLTDAEKLAYCQKASNMRQEFAVAKVKFDQEMASYRKKYPQAMAIAATAAAPAPKTPAASTTTALSADTNMAVASPKADLFNKVVRLRPGAPAADGKYWDRHKYWYVLTYIPDLQWCHLAPMVTVGTFGSDKPKAQGRPKYKLEDEALGLEVDISSSFCIPVKAKSMRHTVDADKEEWDVRDDGTEPGAGRRMSVDSSMSSIRSATKPSAVVKDRKRKRPLFDSIDSTLPANPVLEAIRPDTQQLVRVVVRQRGPGRPPKQPKRHPATVTIQPSHLVTSTSTSTGGRTSGTSSSSTSTDEEDSSVFEEPVEGVGASSSSSINSTGSHQTNNSKAQRPKRLSAPSFLGEASPLSPPRIRQQSVRGRNPAKY